MTDPNNPVTPPPANPYVAPPVQYAAPPAGPPTNTLAILSLVAAFVFAPAAIILGHIATGQIRRTGEGGAPLALWGTILGYVFTVVWIIVVIIGVLIPLLWAGAVFGQLGDVVDRFGN